MVSLSAVLLKFIKVYLDWWYRVGWYCLALYQHWKKASRVTGAKHLPLARRQVTPLAYTVERDECVGRGVLVLTTGDPLVFWSITPRAAPKMDDLVISSPLLPRFHAQRGLHTWTKRCLHPPCRNVYN